MPLWASCEKEARAKNASWEVLLFPKAKIEILVGQFMLNSQWGHTLLASERGPFVVFLIIFMGVFFTALAIFDRTHEGNMTGFCKESPEPHKGKIPIQKV